MTTRFMIPKTETAVARDWTGLKLCDPLGPWREDVPDLWPHCVVCGSDIRTGQRYAVGFPNRVLCIPCSGLNVRELPKRATFVSLAERQFGGGA